MYRAAYDVQFSGSNEVGRTYHIFRAKNKSAAKKAAEKYLKLLTKAETIKGIPKLISVEKHIGNSVSIEDIVEFPSS